MAKRRIVFTTEHRAEAVIDEEKLALNYGEMTAAKLENHLASAIECGDTTVRDVLTAIGVEGEIDLWADGLCDAEVQEECPKHPGEFLEFKGKKGKRCIRCAIKQ